MNSQCASPPPGDTTNTVGRHTRPSLKLGFSLPTILVNPYHHSDLWLQALKYNITDMMAPLQFAIQIII